MLAVLVGLSIALLTAYFGESASGGLHAVQRGFMEALAPLQEGASRALKPARDLDGWVGDVFDAKSENEDLRERGRAAARASLPRRRPRSATPSSCARWSASTARTRFPDGYEHVAARVIGRSPTVWYSTITIDKGSDQGVRADQPVVTGDGLVGKVSDVSSDAAQVTLITDHTSGVSAQVVPGRRERPREGDGRRPLRPAARLRPEGPRRCARARPSSRRAGGPPGSSRCSRAASRSAGSRASTASERELYQRVHLRPFADLRRLDVVEVLIPSSSGGADERAGGAVIAQRPGSAADRGARAADASCSSSRSSRRSRSGAPTPTCCVADRAVGRPARRARRGRDRRASRSASWSTWRWCRRSA